MRLRLAVLLWWPASIVAADTGRSKIGLSLAGGSSWALVHVGVLEWLEENRIPIDALAGTSMGGLVGGYYATGASSAELKAFLEKVDWTSAMQSSPPFRQLSFRRKEDRRDFPNSLEFGIKHGFRLPSALSPGHGVGLVLSQIAGAWNGLRSFDDLPTPFRCVAADLVTGRQVVFDQGDLFDALRATMALPGLFAPVERDGQVLVDGGVLNNLPVDITRKMGAEVVIAVALHAALPKKAGQYTLLDVANRSLDLIITADELRSMANADIVLIPDLQGIQSTEFHRALELVQRGYDAARQKAAVLRRFSVSEQEWRSLQEARKRKRRPDVFDPAVIQVEGLTPPLKRNLEMRLEPVLIPPADRRQLHEELTRITGLGRWDSANYRLLDANGKQTLAIKVHEKPQGPPFLNLAISIDGATSQPLRFGIAGRLTHLDVGNPGSEWRVNFGVGIRDHLDTEFFHRIRSSKWFAAPSLFLSESTRDLYEDSVRTAQFQQREMGGAVDFGYAAGRFSEFRLGYAFSDLRNRVSIGLPSVPSLQGNFSRFRARYVHEGQDSAIIATRGLRVAAFGQWVLDAPRASGQFPILETDVRWAIPLRGSYYFTSALAGGTTIRNQNLFAPFTLGGPLRLSALAIQQDFGSHYYYGQSGVLRQLSRSPLNRFGKLYVSLAWEFGAAFSNGEHHGAFHDGVVGLAGETPIGVLFFGGSFGESGNRKLFFRLGRFF